MFLGGARTLVSAQEVVAQLCLGLTEPQVWDVIKEIEAKGEYIFFGEGLDRRSRNLTKTEALKRWL